MEPRALNDAPCAQHSPYFCGASGHFSCQLRRGAQNAAAELLRNDRVSADDLILERLQAKWQPVHPTDARQFQGVACGGDSRRQRRFAPRFRYSARRASTLAGYALARIPAHVVAEDEALRNHLVRMAAAAALPSAPGALVSFAKACAPNYRQRLVMRWLGKSKTGDGGMDFWMPLGATTASLHKASLVPCAANNKFLD